MANDELKDLPQLKHLLYLLEDDDVEILDKILEELISLDVKILPFFEMKVQEMEESSLLDRYEHVIYKIRYKYLQKELLEAQANRSKAHEFIESSLISLAKFHYQELDTCSIHSKMSDIEQEINFKISIGHKPTEAIEKFNTVFFQTYRFKVLEKDIPQYFHLNQVLSSKNCSASILTLLYFIFANRVKLPIVGLAIENQLFLAFSREKLRQILSQKKDSFANQNPIISEENLSIDFLIDPSQNGLIIQKEEMLRLLEKSDIAISPYMLKSCSADQMMSLFFAEFSEVLKNNREKIRSEEMEHLSKMLYS